MDRSRVGSLLTGQQISGVGRGPQGPERRRLCHPQPLRHNMKLSTVLSLSLLSALCADGIAQAPGAHWSLITGVSGPSQRRENPGAASSTKFFVFGGKSGNSGGAWMNDLWEYEPIAKSWKELTANGAAGSPLKRDQAGVCFDPGRQKLIVFGGNTWNGVKNDTWEFDFKTGTWKDITPATGNPPARRFHSIAFDPNSGEPVRLLVRSTNGDRNWQRS